MIAESVITAAVLLFAILFILFQAFRRIRSRIMAARRKKNEILLAVLEAVKEQNERLSDMAEDIHGIREICTETHIQLGNFRGELYTMFAESDEMDDGLNEPE